MMKRATLVAVLALALAWGGWAAMAEAQYKTGRGGYTQEDERQVEALIAKRGEA